MPSAPRLPLTPSQRQVRFFGLAGILLFLIWAWFLHPSGKPGWTFCAFHSLSGLPCPLCGGTRATHCLLHGNLEGVLYYNWLALPSFLAGLAVMLALGLELAKGRVCLPKLRLSRAWLVAGLVSLLVIWIFHIRDALESPKPELLNTGGLYFQLKPENNHRNP